MAAERDDEASDERGRYRAGLPDHHDPTAGVGSAPAHSALTLRLVLAAFGLLVCVALAIWAVMIDAPVGWIALLVVLAVVALVDLGVVVRRKLRREPG
jgi:hypothetical protein